MIVFVLGATGVIGRPLIEQLLAAGHEVIGTTRSREKAAQLRAAGAAATVVDAHDMDAMRTAIVDASPQVVVNQLTDLSTPLRPGGFGEWLRGTVRLRRQVTPTLVETARQAGATRIIVQTAAFTTAPAGPEILDETAPLYLGAPEPLTGTITSNAEVETVVTGARGIDGVALRYGFFYGPGTALAPDGEVVQQIRDGAHPVVGTGKGRFSFVHVDDAAAATVLALDHGSPGIYNVVDDSPAPMRDWVPYVADLIGAPTPETASVPQIERDLGHQAVYYGTQLRWASNAKAQRQLGFTPLYPDWRDGFKRSFRAR